MRITLLTAGSEGDVRPYVALGLGLQAAGHTVRLATYREFQEFVTSRGLPFVPIASPASEIISPQDWRGMQTTGYRPARFVWYLKRLATSCRVLIERMLSDSWQACQGTEAIVSSATGLGGPHIAERLGVPHCFGLLQPWTRTRAFPQILTPTRVKLGGGFNRLTYSIADRIYWWIFGNSINLWRTSMLGLRPLWSPRALGVQRDAQSPILYAYSPSFVPKPRDWGADVHVTGYWFLDSAPDWHPPGELVDFLGSGPPPVYVDLLKLPFQLQLAVETFEQLGQRGVVRTDAVTLNGHPLPGWVLTVPPLPHDWLLPRMAAAAHHAGAGTVGATLRAGIPCITIPETFDHPFWSRHIADQGLGPPPILPKQVSLATFGQAISAAAHPTMRARAAAFGERVRAENGVATAVAHLNRYFGAARVEL